MQRLIHPDPIRQRRILQEVGARLGLTHERVRQLEKQALARLRETRCRERLLDWAN